MASFYSQFLSNGPLVTYSVAVSGQGSNVSQERQLRRWDAHLNLYTELRDNRTRLVGVDHKGPLRVQRPLAQADGSCHIYLLHPPGGLVGGDSLDISITAGLGTHTVVTTPAAGKHYGCLPGMPGQTVRQTLTVAEGAYLEWVPQESIFFDKTNALVIQQVDLEASSQYLGWEILTLGRRGSGEDFSGGALSQSLELRVAGRLIHRENLMFDQQLQDSLWGLNARSVVGTLVAVTGCEDPGNDLTEELRCRLNDPNWGVTTKERTLLVRYVGDSAEVCREGFFEVRDLVSSSIRPRIWTT